MSWSPLDENDPLNDAVIGDEPPGLGFRMLPQGRRLVQPRLEAKAQPA